MWEFDFRTQSDLFSFEKDWLRPHNARVFNFFIFHLVEGIAATTTPHRSWYKIIVCILLVMVYWTANVYRTEYTASCQHHTDGRSLWTAVLIPIDYSVFTFASTFRTRFFSLFLPSDLPLFCGMGRLACDAHVTSFCLRCLVYAVFHSR